MMSIRDFNALSVVANVEQGARVKRLTEFVQFVAIKYDKLVELYEELEGESYPLGGNRWAEPPGTHALSDILDKLKDGGFVENSKYWTDRDQWEREREYPEGYRWGPLPDEM